MIQLLFWEVASEARCASGEIVHRAFVLFYFYTRLGSWYGYELRFIAEPCDNTLTGNLCLYLEVIGGELAPGGLAWFPIPHLVHSFGILVAWNHSLLSPKR
jgi:hypothetical protein